MSLGRIASFVVSLSALSGIAQAGSIVYATPGVPAGEVALTAAATGSVQGYFVGQSAANLDSIALLDLSTGYQSAFMFPNHTTAPGTMADFGSVNAGDELVFLLYNATLGTTLRSDAGNTDGDAHAYIASFAGGDLSGSLFPAATYVGFEDHLAPNSDFDYNDNMFLFTDVSGVTPPPSAVPEPGTLALLGTGALGAFGVLRRRFPRA